MPMSKIVCFKCHGHGHYKNECPNARVFTAQEWRDIKADTREKVMLVIRNGRLEEDHPHSLENEPDGTYIQDDFGNMVRYEHSTEEDSEEERERVLPEEEHYNMIVRRSLHSTCEEQISNQRENIFQTKCRIGDKVCDLIIDGGSETNCVSVGLVSDLKLRTKPHPHPYKLKWLDNNSSGSVNRQ